MQRIIISVSELNKSNWALIYKFIKDFYKDSLFISTFQTLKEQKWLDSLKVAGAPNRDIYYAGGQDLIKANRPLKDNTTFSILYKKQKFTRSFSELIPFLLIREEFKRKISLGIDINNFPGREKNEYIFASRQFFSLVKNEQIDIENNRNIIAGNSLYLIHHWTVTNKDTGEITTGETSKLGNKAEIKEEETSRYFTPLIEINTDNINALFVDRGSSLLVPEIKYFNISINKIDLSKYTQEKEEKIHFNSVFEEFFIKSFYHSLEVDKEDSKINLSTIKLLKLYCDNIRELVENIIFHTTEKKGLFYFAFNKKTNIINSNNIPNFACYNDNERFVEIGVYDYNRQGILETYNANFNQNNAVISFDDFFNPQSITTTGIDDDHLDLRHAAHLGLKSFTKSIKEQQGYFSVETNNGNNGKLRYNSNNKPVENDGRRALFINGTHYKIILPVQLNAISTDDDRQSTILTTSQNTTVREQLINEGSLININIDEYLNQLSVIPYGKQEQIELIENVGRDILMQYGNTNKQEIAINLRNKENVNSKMLFKVISFLQLCKSKGCFRKIILTHISEDLLKNICEDINTLLVDQNKKIWSKDSALILLTDNLKCQIIWGETKEELYAINRQVSLIYLNENEFGVNKAKINLEDYNFQDFVLLYDVLIVEPNEQNEFNTIFENYVSTRLDAKIEQEGYKSSIDYTHIGSKVVIKNFYEADSLFKNSFFVERFGYLISKNIIKSESKKENIVLIGYLPYSDLLINTIEYYINKEHEGTVLATIIAKEGENGKLIWLFDNENKVKNNTNQYITIIPIGSTLTTNDKIIAFFKQYIQKESNQTIGNDRFTLNYCAILVRDKLLKNAVGELEQSQNWEKSENKTITTNLKNAKTIHYLVAKEGEWHLPIDKEFYPIDYKNEKPVNQTQNSSLNYQNLFYYPKVKSNTIDFNREISRIETLKKFIYCGHLINFENHHRYYVETEDFVKHNIKDEHSLMVKWVKEISVCFDKNAYNVLITPNTNIESDFVNQINYKIFNGNALILYLDIYNWRNNVKLKFSFLKKMRQIDKQIQFHFLDHALLTGESCRKSKSYMSSILDDDNFEFTNIITFINRMSLDKNKEIKKNNTVKLHSFINLFVPPSKDSERDCSLCAIHKHYENLKKYSVIDSCVEVITQKQERIKEKEYNKYKAYNKETDKPKIINDRQFNTMLVKHTIYYKISNIIHDFEQLNDKNYEKLDIKIKNELDALYAKYVADDKNNNNREYEFAFLKSISQAPLSNYAKIKNYAHKKLLEVLSKLLTEDKRNIDNYKLLRVTLKRLSMLKSNALVRREVIIKSWIFYFEYGKYLRCEIVLCKDQIQTEKAIGAFLVETEQKIKNLEQELKKSLEFKSEYQFFIKNAIFDDEAKSLYLGELIRTGKEVDIENLKKQKGTSKTELNNNLFTYFDKSEYSKFASEYKEFLNWLFYDNTTNIRKTLKNFENELEKSDELNNIFYEDNVLKNFSNIDFIKVEEIIVDKIKTEYYYSVFKQYISPNKDEIDFTKRILYILYAKKQIAELNNNPDIKKLDDLLEVFAEIMGADAAFLSLKDNVIDENVDLFTIAKYGINEEKYENIEKYQLPFDQYYTSKILQQNEIHYQRFAYPLIINYELDDEYEENEIIYNEDKKHFICLLISDPERNRIDKTELLAVITFVFKKEYTKNNFEIEGKEHGRLLLLLKKELTDFIKYFLIDKKVFDLWIEKTLGKKTFDRIYRKSDHIFRSVKEEMEEFMNLDYTTKEKFSKTWFWLTNEMIGYMYSTIEYNKSKQLNLEESNKKSHTLGDIFDDNFSDLQDIIIKKRWVGKSISFNDDFDETIQTPFNKYFILTFLFQCMNNTFDKKKNIEDNVSVRIDIQSNSITIYDVFSDNRSEYQRNKNAKIFEKIKPYIQKLDLKRYSSTTLTSLQAYINFVNKTNPNVSCDYGFDDNNCFYVRINF